MRESTGRTDLGPSPGPLRRHWRVMTLCPSVLSSWLTVHRNGALGLAPRNATPFFNPPANQIIRITNHRPGHTGGSAPTHHSAFITPAQISRSPPQKPGDRGGGVGMDTEAGTVTTGRADFHSQGTVKAAESVCFPLLSLSRSPGERGHRQVVARTETHAPHARLCASQELLVPEISGNPKTDQFSSSNLQPRGPAAIDQQRLNRRWTRGANIFTRPARHTPSVIGPAPFSRNSPDLCQYPGTPTMGAATF
ncbi:hypothetical protein AAFF_G00252080 [Aldrovandia affinis]|uniref:Uncharacterized protein n=1 Tax=Aldrovandia affinis TaxID=143900 RepID=A0AAD7SUQ4_9TELE|nr:hypothetical protein AAFF_G00252080 [Aldrovandia affinis]